MAGSPASNLITVFEDSRRWRNIVRRPGDIVISTPPKSGSTWTQGIVASLLWPNGDAPGSRSELSPWVDSRVPGIEALVEQLEAQTHRRFLKTHSPGDCIPFDVRCQYIVVYRDGRDALVSWENQRSAMRPEAMEALNVLASNDGVVPVEPKCNGDYDALFDEWQMVGSPTRHLVAWWQRRHEGNVLFVHYNDLTIDLEGEMRRIAGFLDIEIENDLWPQVVERCGPDVSVTNGRWRDMFSDALVNRYLATVAEQLPDDAAAWLEQGSLGLGQRPDQIGQADTRVLDTSTWHPVFSRLGRQRPTNSIDAIAERRVSDAREAGLFDDLALSGKPIPDLDRQRQPGWWANQFVAKERNKVIALQLEQDLRDAMPALWRLETSNAVTARVGELNGQIDRCNRATTLEPMDRLDPATVLTTWRRLRDER